MTIAIIGATSQIAKDFVSSFQNSCRSRILLYARDIRKAKDWMQKQGLVENCSVHRYSSYGDVQHDIVINFVGSGDPLRTRLLGREILSVTRSFDDLIIDQLKKNPQRKYIFLSSGAVFGDSFLQPVTQSTPLARPVIDPIKQNYYSVAKIEAEIRHRSLTDLSIVDLRVFNIFSHTQNVNARFLITDIVRSIINDVPLVVSPTNIIRDFLHPADFSQIIQCIISAPSMNCAIDCFTREPIDKNSLLDFMRHNFGLKYEVEDNISQGRLLSEKKIHYYSKNNRAAVFGYKPTFGALDTVENETHKILTRLNRK